MKTTLTLITTLVASASLHAAPDILIADFEGSDYAGWKTTGEAFGTSPALGTFPGQNEVTGFLGKGLVNTFFNSDDATGELTSPPFKIERKHITFLMGGGGFSDETCMNLIVDGKVARTAVGPNMKHGGSEALAPFAWDVTEFLGKQASLVIIDQRKGTWGHINVDHIRQVDDKGDIPLASKPPADISRKLKLTAAFLQLPLMNRVEKAEPGVERLTIEDASGKVVRFMNVKFPASGAKPDYWYSADVREFAGQEVTLRFRSHDAQALDNLRLEDTEIIDPKAYEGPHRPRFHFSPRIGWMNDVNGTYYHDGLYHLFYQANPTTAAWSTGFYMHWGHSVSKDLIHWEEWPIALFPDHAGNCYSGAAIVVKQSIPGLVPKAPAPVIFFSGTSPFSQHVATTPDGGRTWQRYAGNPVVPNIGGGDRDPKVVWHEESKTYAMILYITNAEKKNVYLILNSKDLIDWDVVSELPDWYECPEFFSFKSPTTGKTSWLLYGNYSTPPGHPKPFSSRSAYVLGDFDGRTFTPRTEPRDAHYGPNFYGALIFDNAPQDRRIMMAWTSGTRFPGEPFNQTASLPLEMKIKAINGQDALTYEPAVEVDALRAKTLLDEKDLSAEAAQSKLAELTKDQQLDVSITVPATESFKLRVRALQFHYDAATRTLTSGHRKIILHPTDQLRLRVLIDRGVVESFWNEGEAAFCQASLHTDEGPAVEITGTTTVKEIKVHQLSNIWEKR